jgi:hypothetical protein
MSVSTVMSVALLFKIFFMEFRMFVVFVSCVPPVPSVKSVPTVESMPMVSVMDFLGFRLIFIVFGGDRHNYLCGWHALFFFFLDPVRNSFVNIMGVFSLEKFQFSRMNSRMIFRWIEDENDP